MIKLKILLRKNSFSLFPKTILNFNCNNLISSHRYISSNLNKFEFKGFSSKIREEEKMNLENENIPNQTNENDKGIK